MYINSSTQPLDSVVLAGIAALSKTEPWHGVSSKYAFLSTAKVIEALGSEGIKLYSCKTSYTRMEDRKGYTKHMLRFRPTTIMQSCPATSAPLVGGVHPEIVLTNSHDRGSSFCIELGLFRLVCSNGLVVSSDVFDAYKIRHVGTDIEQVLGAVHSIVEQFPQVEESVRRFQSIELTNSQREHFAALAMGLRWDADKVPFESARLLAHRRMADQGRDLWSTYNVIQENLIKGQSLRFARNAHSTREIKSIDSDLTINRGLWSLAEQFSHA